MKVLSGTSFVVVLLNPGRANWKKGMAADRMADMGAPHFHNWQEVRNLAEICCVHIVICVNISSVNVGNPLAMKEEQEEEQLQPNN